MGEKTIGRTVIHAVRAWTPSNEEHLKAFLDSHGSSVCSSLSFRSGNSCTGELQSELSLRHGIVATEFYPKGASHVWMQSPTCFLRAEQILRFLRSFPQLMDGIECVIKCSDGGPEFRLDSAQTRCLPYLHSVISYWTQYIAALSTLSLDQN